MIESVIPEGVVQKEDVVDVLTAPKSVVSKRETPSELVESKRSELRIKSEKTAIRKRELQYERYIDDVGGNLEKIDDLAIRGAVQRLVTRNDPREDDDNYTRKYTHDEIRGLMYVDKVNSTLGRVSRVGESNFSQVSLAKLKGFSGIPDEYTDSQIDKIGVLLEYFDEVLAGIGKANHFKGVATEVDLEKMDPMERVFFDTQKRINDEHERRIKSVELLRG